MLHISAMPNVCIVIWVCANAKQYTGSLDVNMHLGVLWNAFDAQCAHIVPKPCTEVQVHGSHLPNLRCWRTERLACCPFPAKAYNIAQPVWLVCVLHNPPVPVSHDGQSRMLQWLIIICSRRRKTACKGNRVIISPQSTRWSQEIKGEKPKGDTIGKVATHCVTVTHACLECR